MNFHLPVPYLSINYLRDLSARLKEILFSFDARKVEKVNGVAMLTEYEFANLPDATLYKGGIVYVSDDATTGPVIAYSDGTQWLKCCGDVVSNIPPS